MTYIKDNQQIEYPKGTSLKARREVRKMIVSVSAKMIVSVSTKIKESDTVIIACSGGIDSTVLVHAVGQALRIRPNNAQNKPIKAFAVYVNHNLRSTEVQAEANHVQSISETYLGHTTPPIELDIGYGPGIQDRARNARYEALTALVNKQEGGVSLLFGHNKNDQVETRLFQFIKGNAAAPGIPASRKFTENCVLARPLLTYSRQDIENYAKIFKLTWKEDSSNSTDAYSRNKIRHHLIPWVEANLNPGLVKTLGG